MWKKNWKLKRWKEGDEEISFCSFSRRGNSGFASSCDDNRHMSLRNFVEEPLHLLIDMMGEKHETSNLCNKMPEDIKGIEASNLE